MHHHLVGQESVPLLPATQSCAVQDGGLESHAVTEHLNGASLNLCAISVQYTPGSQDSAK